MLGIKIQAILIGCVFLLLVGLRLIFMKTAGHRRYFEILVLLGAAIVFIYPVLNEAGIFFTIGLLNHLYLPVYYVFGPAIYLVTLCYLGKYRGFSRKSLFLFMPAMTVLVLELLAYGLYPSLFDRKPREFFFTDRVHLFDLIEYAGYAFNAVFFAITGYVLLKSISIESIRKEKSIRLFLVEIVWISIGTGITAAGYIVRDMDLTADGILALLLLAVIAFIFTQYHESAYDEIGRAVERYQKSRLDGVDIQQLERSIEMMMNGEKLFIQEDLTLAGLAEKLGVRSYQLSEYLNGNRNMNFSRFINEYRIAEACRLLLENRDANIIHTAYAVGYNSKANFNLAFKTITGMTPSEYLKKNGKKS